jgi:hypothetical protein
MSDHAEGAPGAGPSQRAVEVATAIGMGVFAAIVIGSIKAGIGWGDEGPKAGFFPFYVGLMILLASVINMAQAWSAPHAGKLFAEWGQLRQVVSVVIPTAVYVAVIPWTGIYLASMFLIAVFMRWLGRYHAGLIAAVSIGMPVAFFLIFEKWFLVPLPKGPIENLLGL